jgi:hypothetical protein
VWDRRNLGVDSNGSTNSALEESAGHWTGILIDIPAEVDCFFIALKFPAPLLQRENLASGQLNGGRMLHTFPVIGGIAPS